jgi:four helix bundle protein
MTSIRVFTDLVTWKEAHVLALFTYSLTKKFPKSEAFGLITQMQRAAVSITSNIAEGFGRRTFKDKCHFYYLSRGSLTELHNQLILSKDLSYISPNEYSKATELVEKCSRLLRGLIVSTTKNDTY